MMGGGDSPYELLTDSILDENGAHDGNRTHDLLFTKEVRYLCATWAILEASI